MIKTEITVFARFKETFGSQRTIESDEDANLSLKEVLIKLCDETEGGYGLLFDEDGELSENVLLMLNKKRVPAEEAEEIIIKDGDGVVLYPPVSGG